MSWLSLPLPNPFKSLQETDEKFSEKQEQQRQEEEEEERDQQSPSRGTGVKGDLSELGKTIGRQLWGVASFLAPPPTTGSAPSEGSDSSSQALLGIRNDFAEIGGSFKSRLSMISTNRAVNEISKLASNLLQFEEEEDERDESSEEGSRGGNVGVTEEVLEFVREMSMRLECWIDFPLSLDDYDFDMSNAQREHAWTIEHLAPGLVTLKNKLCPNHMKEGHFWIIYFILLHPRLSKHDMELLSTPQILEARDLLLQKLQNKEKAQVQRSKADDLLLNVRDKGTDAQEVSSPVEKQEALVRTVNTAHQEEEDADQWLEEDLETRTSHNQLGNEQDVSFSDLEDDDDNDTSTQPSRSSPLQNARASSPSGSSGWVQLSENSKTRGSGKKTSRDKDSEGESSNEWLTVDDFDSDSVGAV